MDQRRRVSRRLLVVWLAALFALTLFPFGPPRIPGRAFVLGSAEGVDLWLNILFFLPGGLLLVSAGLSVATTVAVAALLSQTVETLQIWIPGRYPSLLDVCANAGGAWAGAVVGPWVLRHGRWAYVAPVKWALLACGLAAALVLAPHFASFASPYAFAVALLASLGTGSMLGPNRAMIFSTVFAIIFVTIASLALGWSPPPACFAILLLGASLGAWPHAVSVRTGLAPESA